ncbi:MAG TPA: PilZ domain-containing protein [Terriglobales bacterium]|nr:PilZ domain-containing protein [Terriglobales bacterium]
MGQRRELRKEVRLPVRIFGTDASGHVFSENVFTLDISRSGARLEGVQAQIKVGEIIGLSYKQNKGRFAVQWAGQPGTPRAGQLGLRNTALDKNIWEISLPVVTVDPHKPQGIAAGADRRQHPRLKCTNSVQLQPEGQPAPIWLKALDLSSGGCFIEMPMPLKQGTKVKIGLWVNENKLWLSGKVVNSRPGFGIGVQFTEVSESDAERLQLFLRSITQLRV